MIDDNEALRDKFDWNSDIFNVVPGGYYLLFGPRKSPFLKLLDLLAA